MAQAIQDEKIEKKSDDDGSNNNNNDSNGNSNTTNNGEVTNTNTNTSSSRTSTSTTTKTFKFNAQAPEFVPSSHSQMTAALAGYYYPYYNYLATQDDVAAAAVALAAADWMYYGDQIQDQQLQYLPNHNFALPNNYTKNYTNPIDDLQQRIIKQVEYQFSGLSLLSNESLVKQINKDPEGYVPVSVIASTKKVKSLNASNPVLLQALRCSSMLVVSNDGKKVKRKYPFTDKEREELQSRTVVVENLPEDHSHQNLEKIFNVVGSVKTIRICHPQESSSSRPKSDYICSNKLHALVEYENTETAERAVDKLNDERNWRKGLRVSLYRSNIQPKSVLRRGKSDFDGYLDDEDDETPQHDSSEHPNHSEPGLDSNAEESSTGTSSKKGWGRGKGKGRPRVQSHNGRGLLAPSPNLSSFNVNCEAAAASAPPFKQVTKGPRMPDGTRGFTMGRGRPILATPILGRTPSY